MIISGKLIKGLLTARPRDQRGQSISLLVLMIMSALLITTGLVIDGGQKVAATSRAESAAAGAVGRLEMRRRPNSWVVRTRQVPQCSQQRLILPASPALQARSTSPTESSW